MKKIVTILGASLVFLSMAHDFAAAQNVAKITKYVIDVPPKFYVAYSGENKTDFSNGFLTGFGSGICFKSLNKDGSMEFFGITDRGPNGDGPNYEEEGKKSSAKFFPSPDFQPEIGVIRVKGDKAEVISTIGLKTSQGTKITGLPVPPGKVGATNEVALAEDMKQLGYDGNGLDTEGIARDGQGKFWVCDEYGPFLVQFDKQGKMLKKFAPGDGLPEILKNRIPNRGFEGIAVTPSGIVYGIIQSPLDMEGVTGKTARFTRIVKLDPKTGKTAMYAYPIDFDAYKKPKDAKIGDLYAISDTKLLVIEQGADKNKNLRNLIYEIDVNLATDLSDFRIEGKEPEFFSDPAKLGGLRFAEKKLICDLRAYGWQAEKCEGLTVLPDKKTLVVTNDNDFGMSIKVEDNEHVNAEVDQYTLLSTGSFLHKGKPAQPRISICPNGEADRYQQLWLIELDQPIS